MTNDELREKIGLAKGYKWYEFRGCAYLCTPTTSGMLEQGAVRVDEPHPDRKRFYRFKNYPENIAYAMELFEEMRADEDCIVVALEAGHSGHVTCAYEGFTRCIERNDTDKARAICLVYHAYAESK